MTQVNCTKSFYLISDGEVQACEADTEFDGFNSVIAYAYDEKHALDLANKYDNDIIQLDNVWYNGKAYAALS